MTDEHRIDLDPARRCMLVERVAEILNDIPVVGPVQRVVLVGKGVQHAAMNNDALKAMLGETRFIDALHAQARLRTTGGVVLPSALQGDVGISKETQRA